MQGSVLCSFHPSSTHPDCRGDFNKDFFECQEEKKRRKKDTMTFGQGIRPFYDVFYFFFNLRNNSRNLGIKCTDRITIMCRQQKEKEKKKERRKKEQEKRQIPASLANPQRPYEQENKPRNYMTRTNSPSRILLVTPEVASQTLRCAAFAT